MAYVGDRSGLSGLSWDGVGDGVWAVGGGAHFRQGSLARLKTTTHAGGETLKDWPGPASRGARLPGICRVAAPGRSIESSAGGTVAAVCCHKDSEESTRLGQEGRGSVAPLCKRAMSAPLGIVRLTSSTAGTNSGAGQSHRPQDVPRRATGAEVGNAIAGLLTCRQRSTLKLTPGWDLDHSRERIPLRSEEAYEAWAGHTRRETSSVFFVLDPFSLM